MSQSSRGATRQEQDQALVPVGGDIGEADDHGDADKGRTGGEPHAPPAAVEIASGYDPRNTDQDRHVAERSEVVDLMERGVEVLRSEEHTSELQSQSNLVCRLLLEKKKKTTKQN